MVFDLFTCPVWHTNATPHTRHKTFLTMHTTMQPKNNKTSEFFIDAGKSKQTKNRKSVKSRFLIVTVS